MPGKRTGRIWELTAQEMQAIIDKASSYQDVIRHFGLAPNGATNRSLKIRIKEDNLDITGLRERRRERRKTVLREYCGEPRPLAEMLVLNSRCSRTHLKGRLISEGFLEEKCAKCKRPPIWEGQPLSLHLDHINGIRDDNRLENLRLLCPNCHSQTPTYGGKANKKEDRRCECGKKITAEATRCMKCAHAVLPRRKQLTISDEDLTRRVKVGDAYMQIAREYGVCQTTVRNRCKKLGIYVNRQRKSS